MKIFACITLVVAFLALAFGKLFCLQFYYLIFVIIISLSLQQLIPILSLNQSPSGEVVEEAAVVVVGVLVVVVVVEEVVVVGVENKIFDYNK